MKGGGGGMALCFVLSIYVYMLDILFLHITTFIKVCAAFVFGLQTL